MTAPDLRIMTYNIRNGRGSDDRVDLARIAEVIRPYKPDVVALQEVDVCRARSGGVDQAGELARSLGLHATFAACISGATDEHYGLATLTRWPVERHEVIGAGDVIVAGALNCTTAGGGYRRLCGSLHAATPRLRTWPEALAAARHLRAVPRRPGLRHRRGRGTRETLELAASAPRAELALRPSVAIDVPRVALARTLPSMEDPPCEEVRELRSLHLRAIAAARESIYIENQYFSSEDIRRALIDRMRLGGDALEIAIVLPQASAGFKEQVTIGVRQAEILQQLKAVSWQTGHHIGVYYAAAPGRDGDVPVFIHSKVLAVDDRFLLVSSANTTNRSMGLDTELGVAWETEEADDRLREARVELMREHCGLDLAEARSILGPAAGLVARLDRMARARTHRLRMHAMCEDDEPGKSIAHALREDVALDPCEPMFEDILPEPGHWYQHGKDRLATFVRRLARLRSAGR